MNRHQRRARPKLSRAEWSVQLSELRKKFPKDMPDERGIAQLLIGIIVDEQLNISDVNLATLAGLTCGFMDRALEKLPQATRVNQDGMPVYSIEQIANFVGQTPAEIESGLKAFAKEVGAEIYSAGDVSPLH